MRAESECEGHRREHVLPTEGTARNGLGMGGTGGRGQIRKGGVERGVGPKSEDGGEWVSMWMSCSSSKHDNLVYSRRCNAKPITAHFRPLRCVAPLTHHTHDHLDPHFPPIPIAYIPLFSLFRIPPPSFCSPLLPFASTPTPPLLLSNGLQRYLLPLGLFQLSLWFLSISRERLSRPPSETVQPGSLCVQCVCNTPRRCRSLQDH